MLANVTSSFFTGMYPKSIQSIWHFPCTPVSILVFPSVLSPYGSSKQVTPLNAMIQSIWQMQKYDFSNLYYYKYVFIKTVIVLCICLHSLPSFHYILHTERAPPSVVECNERRQSCPFKHSEGLTSNLHSCQKWAECNTQQHLKCNKQRVILALIT
jgi:hypothetical protein